jgi:antitoxin HicB
MRKDLNYYLSLNYPVQIQRYDDGTYFAEIPDLPGCMTEAGSPDELMMMIEDAKRAWIQSCLDDGYPVPEPAGV